MTNQKILQIGKHEGAFLILDNDKLSQEQIEYFTEQVKPERFKIWEELAEKNLAEAENDNEK